MISVVFLLAVLVFFDGTHSLIFIVMLKPNLHLRWPEDESTF